MSKFSVKSILLGIGIGIVFMSVISMIYTAGNEPGRELTKDDVRKLAEKYDLIQPTEIFKGTNETTSSNTTATELSNQTSASETANTSETSQASETAAIQPGTDGNIVETTNGAASKDVMFKIEYMATSEEIAARLEKDGVIEKASDFVLYMGSRGLEDKIQVGVFKIPIGASLKEIAGIITKKDASEIE